MAARLPLHIHRNRHGIFLFRWTIPAPLRPVAGLYEVRINLQTPDRKQAIISALPMTCGIAEVIADLKRMAENSESPPADYFKLWIDQARKNISLRQRVEELEDQLDYANRQLDQATPRTNAERVARAAYDKGQLKGKRELEEHLAFPWLPEKTALFSELMAAYLKSFTHRPEGGTKKPPTPKTLESYEKEIGFFVTVMGDLRIGEIDRELAGGYFSAMRRLPANLSRKAKYRGKSIPELLAMDEPPQSEGNASKKMERVSAMFKWALEEKRRWGIDANPFAGFGQSADKETTRRPLTHDELRTILNHPDFANRRFANSYAFWMIPLAVFTGARQGELAQLDLKDFVEIEGIPCIDINDTDAKEVEEEGGRKKRVKNKSAKRLVPIHPELIRMGILRHVATLRQQGGVHLFPELSRTRRDGPGHAVSNWFQRFREKVGMTAKQQTVFHSFRHLFITTLLDTSIPPHMVAPIVGHEGKLITDTVYWNKQDATKRLPTVEAFKLPANIYAMFPSVEDVELSSPRGPRTVKAA